MVLGWLAPFNGVLVDLKRSILDWMRRTAWLEQSAILAISSSLSLLSSCSLLLIMF